MNETIQFYSLQSTVICEDEPLCKCGLGQLVIYIYFFLNVGHGFAWSSLQSHKPDN